MVDRLNNILKQAKEEFSKVRNEADLENFRHKFLGRKAELSLILRQIKDLPLAEKPRVGRLGNEVRKEIEGLVSSAKANIGGQGRERALDTSLPGEKIEAGHLHPLTLFLRKVISVFVRMGFEVVEGREVESTLYNFDLLNIPKNHPARDAWDTFYIKRPEDLKKKKGKMEEMVLRTHTSPMQIRAMEKRKPPVRLIVPGRVFRHEATDAGHETTFYQVEGLVIDKEIKVTDLIGTIRIFLENLFGQKIKVRVRPHYYSFTEPSLDFDLSCLLCAGRGCSVCGQSGWLEMMGSGMVHPKVLKNMKIDPKKYQGFAFGLGLDRFMMLYYGIDDIRLSYQADLRYLKQF